MHNFYYLDSNAHIPRGYGLSESFSRKLKSIENSHIAWGHPLSPNKLGTMASAVVGVARDKIAKLLNVKSHEIFFTNSCTEANSLVVNGIKNTFQLSTNTIGVSPYEHSSMIDPLVELAETICLNKTGDLSFNKEYDISVVVGAQPETGVLCDFDLVRKNTKQIFVSDLAQMAGKIDLNLPKLGVDVATFGGHKFGGALGVGFIYINSKLQNKNFINECYRNIYSTTGYAQDVPGTLNVVDIYATALALDNAIETIIAKREKCLEFRFELEEGLEDLGCQIICKNKNRIYNTSFIRIPGEQNGILVLKKLSDNGIFVGLGSACGSFIAQESNVMKAYGIDDSNNSYIRISQIGEYDKNDARYILNIIYKAFKQLGITKNGQR